MEFYRTMKRFGIFRTFFFCLFFSLSTLSPAQETITLVIDPGHGGKDPGGLPILDGMEMEKELNLKIALKLGNYIKTKLQGVNIIYTRTTDKYVSLEDRCYIANINEADYFISIHCNYNPAFDIHGTRVHIFSRKNKMSIDWANAIDDDLRNRARRKSMGIMDTHDRGYNIYVLQHTNMPAVLVEAGFMSNSSEERYLNSDWGQTLIASSLFRSFREYTDSEPAKEEVITYFQVQIAASTAPENTNIGRYKQLGMEIEEDIYEDEIFKYKYYVGKETSYEAALELLEKVRENGFSDAFLVSRKQ